METVIRLQPGVRYEWVNLSPEDLHHLVDEALGEFGDEHIRERIGNKDIVKFVTTWLERQ
uniref:Uncharacterized protein n=1 Tax=viral metagenome TaxID=1070528 RepID=A0A6M3M4U7_9ZZZZ